MVVDERRRNNIASAKCRGKKKVKRELEEAELKELERRNIELTARVSVMEESIERMKDRNIHDPRTKEIISGAVRSFITSVTRSQD